MLSCRKAWGSAAAGRATRTLPSPRSPPVRPATALKATDTCGPARLLAVTCSHRSQGGEGSSRRQAQVGLMHVSTFWKFLGRVAEPTVRRTGQPRLPLVAQPCSSSRSSWVYSGMKILWRGGHRLAQALGLPPASRITHTWGWASRPETQAHTLGAAGPPTPPHAQVGPPRGSHSLEVAGMGQESLWKGNVGLQDKDLDCPYNQHVGLEDVGTGGNKTLGGE